MKKFTKVIMVIMIVALLLTTIIMPRTTKAADGDNEAIVTINFLDKDGCPLNFADYDKIRAYYLYDYSGYPADGVNYTYTMMENMRLLFTGKFQRLMICRLTSI